jgi:ABC-type multidrug transport system fused ATPase/permease subunit
MAIADIREFTPESWRNYIGLVPQDPVLFTGTIAENIAYGMPNATHAEIEDAARAANCDFIWGMPYGFDTLSTLLMHPPRQMVLIEIGQSVGTV